jgi:uncharacterized protein (TIGR02147 family)
MTSSTQLAPKVQQYSDLRFFISDLYASVRAKNEKFSQSAFATKIGITPSALANFLENRRMLSEESLGRIAKKLRWSAEQMSHATTLRMMNQTTTEVLIKDQIAALAKARQEIAQRPLHAPAEENPALRLIARTLLASLRVPKYAANPLLVASRLGLSKEMVASELENLLKSGAIIRGENGIFRRSEKEGLKTKSVSPEAVRRYDRHLLTLAGAKIRADNAELQNFSHETFAFDITDLKEAQVIINRCLQELMALASQGKNPQAVYHTNIHLFNLLEDPK